MLLSVQLNLPALEQTTSSPPQYQFDAHKGDSADYKVTKFLQPIIFENVFPLANGTNLAYNLSLGTILHFTIVNINKAESGNTTLSTQVNLSFATNTTILSAIEHHDLSVYMLRNDFVSILLDDCIIPVFPKDASATNYFSQHFPQNPPSYLVQLSEKQIVVNYNNGFFDVVNTYDRNTGWLIKSILFDESHVFIIEKVPGMDELIYLLITNNLGLILGLVVMAIIVSVTALKYYKFRKNNLKNTKRISFRSFVKQSNPLRKSKEIKKKLNIDVSLKKIEEILQENQE